jgi:hypothetical protein
VVAAVGHGGALAAAGRTHRDGARGLAAQRSCRSLFWGPPLALFAGGLALFRKSAAARAYLFFWRSMCIFVWYGYRAEQVWRFFEWRFAAVRPRSPRSSA